MPSQTTTTTLPLPKAWGRVTRAGVLHAISVASSPQPSDTHKSDGPASRVSTCSRERAAISSRKTLAPPAPAEQLPGNRAEPAPAVISKLGSRFLGQVPPSGVLERTFVFHELGPNVEAEELLLQAFFVSFPTGGGRKAAESMHARLRGLPEPIHSEVDPIEIGPVRLDHHPERARAVPLARPVSEWLEDPDAEIHLGITEEQFLEEVSRCLSCGQCFGCEQCWMYCPHTCFTRLEDVQPGMYYALTIDQCQACGKCIDVCPCGFLEDRAPTP